MKKTPSAKTSTKAVKEEAAFSRRDMLRAGGLAVAAAGAVAASLSPQEAEAQQAAPAANSPLGGASSGSGIFSVVETQYGKVQGITNAGIRCFRAVEMQTARAR